MNDAHLVSPSGSADAARVFLFIFDNVPDFQQLAAAADPGVSVVVLDSARDGLAQVASALENASGVAAVHIMSHGGADQLNLGTVQLTHDNAAAHADELARIGAALDEHGDLLFYGCDLAADDSGTMMLATIARLTGADVAGSSDTTGAGGNWTLEQVTGVIEAALPVNAAALVAYNYNLGSINITQPGVLTATEYTGTAGNDLFVVPSNASGYDGKYVATGGWMYNNNTWYFESQIIVAKSFDPAADKFDLSSVTAITPNLTYTTKTTTGGNFIQEVGMGVPQVIFEAAQYDAGGHRIGNTFTATSGTYVVVLDQDGEQVFSTFVTGVTPGQLSLSNFLFPGQSANQAPALGGTFATAATVNDNATVSPFPAVTYSDSDGASYTVKISYTAANGALSGTGLAGSAGNYTLTGTSASDVQAKLRALVFTPTANQVAPGSTVQTTFTLTPNDGTVDGTANATTKVTATSINDAPTLSTISTFTGGTEDTAYTITYASLASAANEADADTSTTLSFRIEAVTSGTLKKNGIAVTPGTTTVAAGESLVWTPATNANGVANAFTVKAYDGSLASASAVQVKVDLAAVNDAPTVAGDATLTAIAEDVVSLDHEDVSGTPPNWGDSAYDLLGASGYADAESGNRLAIVITGDASDHLTEGRWQYSTDPATEYWHDIGTVSASAGLLLVAGGTVSTYLRFVPVANYAGTPGGLTVHAVDDTGGAMQYTTWDGTTETRRTYDTTTDNASSPVSALGVTWTVSVTAVNDSPVIANFSAADAQTVASSDGPALLDRGTAITVSDIDNSNFNNGSVNVSISTGRANGDVLALRTGTDVALSAGMTVGSTVSVNGTAIGTIFLGATGASGENLRVNLNANATAERVAKLLQNVTFDTTGSTSGDRTIRVVLNDGAGGASTAASTTVSVTTNPTVAITSTKTVFKAGDTATVQFSFSDPPVGFDASDVVVTGGTLSTPAVTADPKVYTATFTPDGSTNKLSASISVDAGRFADAQGNANLSSSLSLTGDTLAPTLTISSTKTTVKAGETALVKFEFSEAPAGFDNNSVTVSGGTLSAVAVTADPKVYTATFTPTGATNTVAGSVSVAGGAYTDSAGNSGGAGTALNIGGDTLAPTVTISGGGFSLNAGDSVNLTFTFSEAPTGFTDSDLTVTGGTVTNLAVTADPKVYTATFNPAASNNLSASVKVANASYDDAAGNPGSASNTLSFSGDTRAPTVTVSSSNTVLKAGETATISFTFSEAPAGFTDTDVMATGGALSNFGVTADPKVYTATFTPDAGSNSVNASVTVGAGNYADVAGNAGGGGSVTISADTLAPTLAITADKTTLKAGQASTVTFTFSEAPVGFDANDLTVTGGTLGTISATSDPKVFTAQFTPTATDALAATISAGTGYTDANGNAGSTATLHLDGDTLAPGVTIGASKTTLLAGEQAQLTFTFTDVPNGFTLADINASGGTVSDLAATADPKVFTATFVPAASNALAGSVSVSAGSYQDAAGNGGAASNTLSIGGDTQLPQVAVSADRTTFKAGQSALVTFTFTETPTGFTQADVDVTGGALSNFGVTANPKVYTALFNPAAGENSLAGQVSVRGATFTDGAGNANAASAVNVTIDGDTRAPDVSQARITLSGASGTAGAFRTGDTVTASWDNGAAGDNNPDVASVVFDFSQFGGPASVAATASGGVWSASWQLAAGSIDSGNHNVSVTVADHAGNSASRTGTSNAVVDNQSPVATAAAITLSGATGTNGTFRAGDTATATWSGDGNNDIASAQFDFAQFGGGTVAAVKTGSVWSASYAIGAGTLEATGRNVSLSVLDDAGNAAQRAGTVNAAIDARAPAVVSVALSGTPAANATELDYIVTLTEPVAGLGLEDFVLATAGATSASLVSVSGSGSSYVVRVGSIAGNGSLRLDLKAAGTGIADAAGNPLAGGAEGALHTVSFNGAPVIGSNGGGASAVIGLAENTVAVTQVSATDGDNDGISYSISGGADAALFQIDAATGALSFRSAPHFAAPADANANNSYLVEVSASDGKGASDNQAITVNVLRDLDGDGKADVVDDDRDNDGRLDSVEDPVPGALGGNGDGNGDGKTDSEQINVASLPTAVTGNPFATIAVADGLTLTSVGAALPSAPVPRNVRLPLGVLDFTIGGVTVGGTVEVAVYVDGSVGANSFFKQNNSGGWVNIAKSVTTVGSKTKITFDLTDGGAFDHDGVANGSIVDPGAVGVLVPLITSNGGNTTAMVSTEEGSNHVTTVQASALGAVTYAISGGADAGRFKIDPATGKLAFVTPPSYASPADLGGTPADNVYVVQVSASDAAGSTTQEISVKVTSAPPPPPPLQNATVDGVSVQVGNVKNSDGSVSTTIVVPVVEPTRQEQVGNNLVADIPLATSGSAPVLMAQVPTGIGLTVTGTAEPKAAGNSLTDLIREIKAHTEAGSHDQTQLTGGGSGFLSEIPASAPLLVQTIVPAAKQGTAGTAPAQALVITGATTANAPMTALVIDTRSLPSGTVLELQDVEFAAVIGNAHVTGGNGSQNVWGDGASQYIMLGADDDVLHGGAGDDVVGSAGGNDKVYGDEGNDLVFGGIGNDYVDGGTGQDVAQFSGSGRADYSLRVKNGNLVMTDLRGADGTDIVANVETLRFTGASTDLTLRGTVTRLVEASTGKPDLVTADRWLESLNSGATKAQAAQAMLAATGLDKASTGAFVEAMYQNILHRAVEGNGKAFWSGLLDSGKIDRAGMAVYMVDSAEKLAMAQPVDVDFNQTDVAALVRMYATLFDRKADEGGLNWWIGLYETGKTLSQLADAFMGSEESKAKYAGLTDAQFVDTLYHTAFHRDAKPGELDFWVNGLAHGTMDRGDVLLGFANSTEMVTLIAPITTSIPTL